MTSVSRSVVVPVFNGFRHLSLFWDSLVPHLCADTTEVIFVDDGSDRSLHEAIPAFRQHPTVRVLRHSTTQGFSNAVNAGLRVASGEHLFILNSDLILREDSLEILSLALVNDPSIALVAGKLLYPQTGRVQHVGLAYSETNHFHIYRHAPANHPIVCRQREVQAAAFALCALPRHVYQAVGSLDENYFNSYEDLDYCFRVRAMGGRLVIEPRSVAYHWEKQSGPARSILRKDNVARLWRDWGADLNPDIHSYTSEAICCFKSRHPDLSQSEFTLIDLSRGREAEEIVRRLSSSTGFAIADVWHFSQRARDVRPLWLPQILPTDAVRHPRPFIYLVDEITELEENAYWFGLRDRFVTGEVMVDHNANVLALSEQQ